MDHQERLAAAWAAVCALVPPEDAALVAEVVLTPREQMYNAAAGAECDLGPMRIRVADEASALTSPYLESALVHELGHLVSWARARDASEAAAEAYRERYWPDAPWETPQ